MTVSKFLVAAATILLSATTFAAGTHGGGHDHGAASGEPGKASEASRTITVEMYDNYYEPGSIIVSPGETVRFVVENKDLFTSSTSAHQNMGASGNDDDGGRRSGRKLTTKMKCGEWS